MNRYNESPLRGEKPHFWPVHKFNTSSLPLCGFLPVKKTLKNTTHTVKQTGARERKTQKHIQK